MTVGKDLKKKDSERETRKFKIIFSHLTASEINKSLNGAPKIGSLLSLQLLSWSGGSPFKWH